MINNNFYSKRGNTVAILLVVLAAAILLAGFLYFNKNKPVANQPGITQTASGQPSYPTASSNVDEQLKVLDDEAKNIDQSLNDKPIDVLAE